MRDPAGADPVSAAVRVLQCGRRRAILASLLAMAAGSALAQAPVPAFAPSFVAGTRDATGHFMGGTEIRTLVTHGGKLFAGNGYWKDVPGPEGTPGAQVLVLDGPQAAWRADASFNDLLPGGRRRHQAISALAEATFSTDGQGKALPAPRTVLLASTWDVTGARTVFVRDDATGAWSGAVLAQDRPTRDFLPQIRAFGTHRDRGTGADTVFAGDTRGVFAGVHDPAVSGGVRWNASPELKLTAGMASGPGIAGRLRISSFAEAGGRLFAAIGQQVWVRQDGAGPQWRLFYTNPTPFYSQTGLRGLTAIAEPGGRQVLLAAVEGNKSRIVRIDPETGADATDLDLDGLLDRTWGTKVSYVVAAYNDMPRLPVSGGGAVLIGLEAFIPPASPRPPGHTVLDVNHGLEAGAWFLLRWPGGCYELREVRAENALVNKALVAVRAAQASPFPNEAGIVYLGGYDANDDPAHDTAWIARSRLRFDVPSRQVRFPPISAVRHGAGP